MLSITSLGHSCLNLCLIASVACICNYKITRPGVGFKFVLECSPLNLCNYYTNLKKERNNQMYCTKIGYEDVVNEILIF